MIDIVKGTWCVLATATCTGCILTVAKCTGCVLTAVKCTGWLLVVWKWTVCVLGTGKCTENVYWIHKNVQGVYRLQKNCIACFFISSYYCNENINTFHTNLWNKPTYILFTLLTIVIYNFKYIIVVFYMCSNSNWVYQFAILLKCTIRNSHITTAPTHWYLNSHQIIKEMMIHVPHIFIAPSVISWRVRTMFYRTSFRRVLQRQ